MMASTALLMRDCINDRSAVKKAQSGGALSQTDCSDIFGIVKNVSRRILLFIIVQIMKQQTHIITSSVDHTNNIDFFIKDSVEGKIVFVYEITISTVKS